MKYFNPTIKLLLMGMVFLMSSSANAVITGSKHDFKGESGGNWTGEICNVCHTPHNADASGNAPLWNHEITGETYDQYVSTGTLDATVGQPGGVSKMCLSCHDGTLAIDSFGGGVTTGDVLSVFKSGTSADFGTDLRNDHPISFTYDTSLATDDGELWDPATTISGLGGNINVDMLFGAGNDQLECASCHDVHDKIGNVFMLRKLNVASALCLTCHNK